jgi:hypothetical protein
MTTLRNNKKTSNDPQTNFTITPPETPVIPYKSLIPLGYYTNYGYYHCFSTSKRNHSWKKPYLPASAARPVTLGP